MWISSRCPNQIKASVSALIRDYFLFYQFTFIVPQLWHDRFIYVARPFHNCGTVVSHI